MPTETLQRIRYELRFQSMFAAGHGYVFPCDAEGHVDLDSLSVPSRNNYLYVRAMVGREFLGPSVQRCQPGAPGPAMTWPDTPG